MIMKIMNNNWGYGNGNGDDNDDEQKNDVDIGDDSALEKQTNLINKNNKWINDRINTL